MCTVYSGVTHGLLVPAPHTRALAEPFLRTHEALFAPTRGPCGALAQAFPGMQAAPGRRFPRAKVESFALRDPGQGAKFFDFFPVIIAPKNFRLFS